MLDFFLSERVGERAIHHALGEAQSLSGELLGYVVAVHAAQWHEIIFRLVLDHQWYEVVYATAGAKEDLALAILHVFLDVK